MVNMQQFNVTGMSCAACSARVEKAVRAVKGVSDCSVNLLTGSMSVEGNVESGVVIDAVVKAGYGASVKGKQEEKNDEGDPGKAETKALKKPAYMVGRLFACADVFFNGPYYVELAAARKARAKPYCHWYYPAAAYHRSHGDKPQILYKRRKGYSAPRA